MLIRTLASSIVKQASNMSLTGAEYMWIMSSVVLCKFEKKKQLFVFGYVLATYSSETEPKMNPYDNPNRRKIDFYTGTLGLLSNPSFLQDNKYLFSFSII